MNIDQIIHGSGPPVIIAHRGASFYFHENTMEAFEAAAEMGAEMVELDVRRTRDGVLVVHHDPDIRGGKIRALSKVQVEEASASAGYVIPTLAEVLQFCGERIPVDVEIKESGYEEQVVETVTGFIGPDRLLISSSDEMAVFRVKALSPEIKTGLVLYSAPFPALLKHLFPGARVRFSGVDVVMVNQKLLKLGFLGLNKGLGRPVWVYTVNDRKMLWKLVADDRIGAVFTDRPDVGLFLRDLYSVCQGDGRRAEGEE